MDARQAKVNSTAEATSTSAGAQIEEFRRRLAEQRAHRQERVAVLNARTNDGRPALADRPLLIAGKPVE